MMRERDDIGDNNRDRATACDKDHEDDDDDDTDSLQAMDGCIPCGREQAACA